MESVRDQERIFCEEYLVDLNATRAALRAGYRPATAHKAPEWIHPDHPTKPALRNLIDQELAKRSRRTGVTADRVVRELARIAFADPLDIIDPNTGGLLKEIDREDRAAIQGYRQKSGDEWVEREVKLADKARALELLGRHLGMFTDAVKVEGAVPVLIDDTGGDAPTTPEPHKIGYESAE